MASNTLKHMKDIRKNAQTMQIRNIYLKAELSLNEIQKDRIRAFKTESVKKTPFHNECLHAVIYSKNGYYSHIVQCLRRRLSLYWERIITFTTIF